MPVSFQITFQNFNLEHIIPNRDLVFTFINNSTIRVICGIQNKMILRES